MRRNSGATVRAVTWPCQFSSRPCICIGICTCMHVRMFMCVRMYVCMHACMYTCIHTYTHTHTHARARAHTHMYIRILYSVHTLYPCPVRARQPALRHARSLPATARATAHRCGRARRACHRATRCGVTHCAWAPAQRQWQRGRREKRGRRERARSGGADARRTSALPMM